MAKAATKTSTAMDIATLLTQQADIESQLALARIPFAERAQQIVATIDKNNLVQLQEDAAVIAPQLSTVIGHVLTTLHALDVNSAAILPQPENPEAIVPVPEVIPAG